MSSWRDFALRGFFRAMQKNGTRVPNEFAKADDGFSRELKGEG
jgi:hypothetical protein